MRSTKATNAEKITQATQKARRVASAAAAIGMAVLLAACAGQGESEASAAAAAQPSGGGAFRSAGDGQFVATDSGIYELQTVYAGSASLFYTDAATAKRIYVCSDPNCEHAGESCTSYISTPGLSLPPMLLSVGDRLGAFVTESTDATGPYLLLMNADGSEKTKAFSLAANQYPQGDFFENDAALYFTVCTVNDDGSAAYSLLRMDKKSNALETVAPLGSGDDCYLLCGCLGGDLLFRHLGGDGQVAYYRANPDELQFDSPIYVDEEGRGNVLFADGYLFTMDDSGTVTRKDLAAGESVALTCPVRDGYTAAGFQTLFDGNVLLTADGPVTDGKYDVCAYFLNFGTNACTEMTLRTPYNDRPVYALAAVGDQVYVAADIREYTPRATSVSGADAAAASVANTYAFLSKTDYEHSNAAGYRMVEDAFE